MGARPGPRAAGLQRGSGAAVGRDPKARARRLIDRVAHQRMAEAKPARHRCRSHQITLDQLVERDQRVLLAEPGGGRGEIKLEGIARHRRSAQKLGRRRRKRLELALKRQRHRTGHLATGQLRARRARRGALRGACQLLEVERNPAALMVKRSNMRVVEPAREQRARGV